VLVNYTVGRTNITYLLNTEPATWQSASQQCAAVAAACTCSAISC
jgi:hypothetical protein